MYEVPSIVVSYDAQDVLAAVEMSGSSYSASAHFDGFKLNANTWISK